MEKILPMMPPDEDPLDKARIEPVVATALKRWSPLEERTCFKCGLEMQSRLALHMHLNRVYPCDLKFGERREEKNLRDPIDRYGIRTCKKCGKMFTTTGGLRFHMARVTPCDAPQSTAQLKCPKFHKTFPSSQDLRLHLMRVFPCDGIAVKKEQSQKSEKAPQLHTCPRCQRTFGTEHGLHVHIGRETAILQKISELRTESPSTEEQAILNIYVAGLERLSTSGNAISAYGSIPKASTTTKAWCRLPTKEEKSVESNRSNSSSTADTNDHGPFAELMSLQEFTATASVRQTRKRIADHEQEGLSRKKTCSEMGRFTEFVARLAKTTPSEAIPHETVNSSISLRDTRSECSGDIETDGCCCRTCMRTWIRLMITRLERLDVQNNSEECHPAPPSNIPPTKPGAGEGVDSTSRHDQGELSNRGLPTTTAIDEDAVKDSMMEKYNHLNGQIITNVRALEDSLSYLKKMSDFDETHSLEMQNQINELRGFIDEAKSKRDEAVATIVAHRWSAKSNQFSSLLEKMVVKSKPDAEKVLHEECAEIAAQLADAELASKQLLERERDKIFMRLLRSSCRVYLLTKEILQDKP